MGLFDCVNGIWAVYNNFLKLIFNFLNSMGLFDCVNGVWAVYNNFFKLIFNFLNSF